MLYEVHNQAELDKAVKAAVDGDEIRIVEDDGGWMKLTGCSSHVEARGSSHVEARGSAHVEARDSSHVVAWDTSHVEARGSVHVVAWDSAHVVAWDSAHVEAREFAVAVSRAISAVIVAKSPTAHAIVSIYECAKTVADWLSRNGLTAKRGKVILYKRVSKDFLTQEGSQNESRWTIGTTMALNEWNPTASECGPGKFHACSHAYFCDEFRNKAGDRYIAVEVAIKDIHLWTEDPQYPHKLSFRRGKVLYECDMYGERITGGN